MSFAPRLVRWLTPIPPDHDGGGGHIRQAYLLDELGRHCEVELIVAGRLADDAVRRAVASVTELAPLELRTAPGPSRRMVDLRMALVERFHREVALHRPVRRAFARELVRRPPAELTCVEFAALAPLASRRRTGHWALTLHNLGSRMAGQAATVTPGRRQRWLHERDRVHAETFERWVGDRYDTVVAVSDDDAAALGSDRVLVVPNGVDLDRYPPSPVPVSPRLVFVGALYTRPNIDGITWFCREILPLVRRAVPDVTLDVVGLRPTAEVRDLGALAGVAVHADVASVVPHLRHARAAIVPLRIGSGSRLKVLEAMAAGRPVVGTSVGFEGLALRPDEHVAVADDPLGLAAATVLLLTDDAVAHRRAAAAHRHVAQHHSWSVIGADYVASLFDRAGSSDRCPRS